ncbi:flagellar biosynthesis protein FliO [Agrobacterium sp. TS43]|nr:MULTISPECIES: flagellar biosynthetic protein FliO [unclassified Agrobacterium]KVK47181.1 flagellar biosynthesis protein FliO [Agrobacterium sp. LY4]KVK47723.1 flagellar biosynthesis protein FliO [Agrobacterium sp. JL28]KVK60498.1 flagellar biosynthesis protein FliO [Agrobacterium sp. TS45]KVK65816.1 flagellar biosynthesis protein FliO [Agrobacterium sp. C13]KVK71305.1 flagellar biosynthesis protein FliO [Agrobacterium sp. TS43]
MISMMEDFIGAYGNRLIVAVVGVGVALLVLAIALWLLRRRSGSAPFIRGGRNRQPRLQVLDATAVDARRRLVLVRRDNVEHLVMIGGPTDIVIESGIGAIPIVRDVQEPELKALPRQESEQKRAEPAIQQERRPALPQQQPVAAAAPVSAPEEPVKQAQRPEPPSPVPSPRPAPVAAATAQVPPRPSTPPQPVPTPLTARETAPPARQAAPERETARPTPPPIPVATAPVAAVLPMAAASLDMAAARTEPRRAEPVVPAPTPVAPPIPAQAPVEAKAEERTAEFAPPVFAAREPVIDQSIAADFLDAARERVLPDLKPGQTTPPAPFPPKPENPAVASNDAEPKFSDELASDFESFLEAEIAKSKEADNEPSIAPVAEKQIKPQPASPPVTGASPDGDMQKEMARIFGELSVTRDR